MPSSSSQYVCQSCGAIFPKWQGQCEQCGQWNSLVEELKPASSKQKPKMGASAASRSGGSESILVKYGEVKPSRVGEERLTTSFGELDRVLGGGLVSGSVVLVGGEPGIGKSTLLTQVVIETLANQADPNQIMYVCGEESPKQISLRIKRYLKNEHKSTNQASAKNREKVLGDNLQFLASSDVDEVVAALEKERPALAIIDSIQTLTTDELTGAPGSIGQLRESADRLTRAAKALHIPIFLVGHVTKEGTIAGPKVLEHMVDCVLEITGERTGQLRLVRAIKNRFGATDEIGVFQHNEYGMSEVSNPSALFVDQARERVPGSAIACLMEGTRPILLEVQSLVVSSALAMPRRVGRGIELSKIQILAAVLQKHCRVPFHNFDLFLSAAGGLTAREPAVDLALAAAMVSSWKDKPLSDKTIFIGEVGLLGEIRQVSYLDRRLKEAKRLGYTHIYSAKTHRTLSKLLHELGLLSRA